MTINLPKINKLFPSVATSVIGILCFLSVVYLQETNYNKIQADSTNPQKYFHNENIEKANLYLLKNAPSFGFSNLIADWAMLRFLQYFGDSEARQHTGYSLSPEYLETVVNHDPRFTRAYFRITPASSIKAGKPERTVALLNEALEHITPDLYRANFLWVYKGIDELLFLGDAKAAQKSYETAAEWSKIIGDSVREKSTRRTAQFLAKNPESKQAQVGAWFNVWVGAPDNETRELAKRKIEGLGGKLEVYSDGRVVAIPPKSNNS